MRISQSITPREHEVLTLIAEGLSSKEVANRLFLTKGTIDFHLGSVYQKLKVSNRIQAVRALGLDAAPTETNARPTDYGYSKTERALSLTR